MENITTESEKAELIKTSRKSTLFIALAVMNTMAILLIGIFVYKEYRQNHANLMTQIIDRTETDKINTNVQVIGELVPLETFLVNLAGSRGRKLVKLSMELEVEGEGIQEEVIRLRPKIRDIIIILLSSKSYAEISNRKGKEELRDEIRDQVNLFLTTGQIRSVYFTQLIFS